MPAPKKSPEMFARLRHLIEVEKVTQKKAAEILGVFLTTVERWIREMGDVHTQRTGPRDGPGHPCWKGGRNIDKDGYVLVWAPDDPMARLNGYVLEHRLVMARLLGRSLLESEVVHHKNGCKTDNSPENLELFSENSLHLAHELKGRCPRWTEDGKRRIQEGVDRWRDTRRRRKVGDAPLSTETTPPIEESLPEWAREILERMGEPLP